MTKAKAKPPSTAPASAAAPQPDPREAQPRFTTIGAGETLADVAKRVDVTVDDLFAANRGVLGSNPEWAPMGTSLVVPE